MTANKNIWLPADWPVPDNINAGTSLRKGGFSSGAYDGLNMGHHVGDNEELVNKNRDKIINHLGLATIPFWLNQTHSTKIISLDEQQQNNNADGLITTQVDRICAIMTADCVPVLFCNKEGTKVAAVHAGWRGICGGIIENAIQYFCDLSSLLVWIGPHITKRNYEVSTDVYEYCLTHSAELKTAFEQINDDHWYCNLSGLIKIILKNAGVGAIYECGLCTYEREDLFYSYRRDGKTGRTASLIWMASSR